MSADMLVALREQHTRDRVLFGHQARESEVHVAP